jgi:anti-sigma regulatory factor (Ser/Thr protein kinase)
VPTIELPAERSAASAARRFTREAASSWPVSPEVEADLELLVSELVTNAVLHARSPAVLSVERIGDRVRVTVTDRSNVLPRLRDYGADAVTGRGLFLVDQLSEKWGVDLADEDHEGKTVWFELSATRVEPLNRGVHM